MNLALCVVHRNNSYYLSVSPGKTVEVGGEAGCDIRLEQVAAHFSVTPTEEGAVITVTDKIGRRKLTAEKNIPVELAAQQELSLVISDEEERRCTCILPPEGEVFVGRSRREISPGVKNNVVLMRPFVSGKHFSVTSKDGRYSVRDLNSTNGLFLNGCRISSAELKDNDTLSIYTVQIVFHNGILYFYNTGKFQRTTSLPGKI